MFKYYSTQCDATSQCPKREDDHKKSNQRKKRIRLIIAQPNYKVGAAVDARLDVILSLKVISPWRWQMSHVISGRGGSVPLNRGRPRTSTHLVIQWGWHSSEIISTLVAAYRHPDSHLIVGLSPRLGSFESCVLACVRVCSSTRHEILLSGWPVGGHPYPSIVRLNAATCNTHILSMFLLYWFLNCRS